MTISFQLIFKELPASVIKQNYVGFLDAIFHVLNLTNEQLVYQVELECNKTLDQFFEKVGIYSNTLLATENNPDHDF